MIQWLIKQIFIEHLLCTWHSSKGEFSIFGVGHEVLRIIDFSVQKPVF